jgi:tetratricopeptide (TPR) repeat protein
VKALNKSKDASGVISKLMEHAALCDSDKYSFALGFASVYENLPQQIRELVQQNNVSEMMVTNVEQMSATYIRRFYLQDLYRFFMLHPNRSELTSPFEVLQKDGKCFFARFASYSTLLKKKASPLCRFLLKHDYLDAMEDALNADMDDFSFLSGLLKHKRGDYEGSMVELRVALDDNPGDPAILKPLAYACYYNHEDEKAIEYYKQLTELDPDHSNAYELRIATILLEDEKVEESLNILYRLHFENEDDLRVRRALAWGLMLDKQLEQAQKHYEVLLEKPKPEDILNAGYCEWFQGKITRAVELFKRYMSITPVGDAAEMSDRQFLRNQFFDDLHLLNVYQIDEVDWTIMVDIVCS